MIKTHAEVKMVTIENVLLLQPAPYKLEDAQRHIFSKPLCDFLEEAVKLFDSGINTMYTDRMKRKHYYLDHANLPSFNTSIKYGNPDWKINPLPARLKCRHVDIGDVSPANTAHFVDALNCDVQGVQVDFDDGHCPTWKNQIQGYYNVMQTVSGKLRGAPHNINTCPILMLRPRAWNIIEHNVMVNGKEIPGALLDFIVLMFHCGKKLSETGSGPFFYLSKMESASEAKLWNDIFIWAQEKLSIPRGTIKACVLIENILSAFEAEEILYNLREHSLGLNCGIWDYIASILMKFGDRSRFILPDRMKYVNIDSPFLKSYFQLVIKVAHSRGAPATGGMVALVLKTDSDETCKESKIIINKVIDMKQKEIMAGLDGFLVYDTRLIPSLNKLWKKQSSSPNQIDIIPNVSIDAKDLLQFPKGGITMNSIHQNVAISILFVYHWLAGVGHFFYNGNVEDSATAEISRSQVWQCIRHRVILEDEHTMVTFLMINNVAQDFVTVGNRTFCRSNSERKRLNAAKYICLELFSSVYPPEFLTTYLNDSHKFRTIHNKALIHNVKTNL